MWDGLDNRKFPRVKTKCETVIKTKDKEKSVSTVTQNIGAGGICIIFEEPLKKADIVDIKLDLGDNLPEIECKGKVVWVIKSKILYKNSTKYDVGIEFIDISEEDRLRVKEMVEEKAKENE